ncbi:MAG: hypothetical protein J7598_18855 [Mitsuaria chitosanitabida]|uniref:hypothetical protein n=1 Tax=Roseateles chitosanitabidus TaxID=65048 RepID=UPI001B233C9E|nr:hypothetical protein [Roseateles chitosanitabidus]MBO9688666.1 hypothetical protein [Roseateles chitosanitabidus]
MQVFKKNYSFPKHETAFDQLQTKGLFCMQDALDDEFIGACQGLVNGALNQRGERYFTIPDIAQDSASPFNRLMQQSELMAMKDYLCAHSGVDADAGYPLLGNNLRVIAGAGEDAKAQALKFHYDSSILTMLVPVMIPKNGQFDSGDLVAKLNDRPFSSSTLLNLVQKSVVQNGLYRKKQLQAVSEGEWADNIIRLEPGSLYFFWGYRSLHANLPCRPGSKRATALFFFGRPQQNDWAMRMREVWRDRKEAKILEQPQ